jgi:hypothetical protein
VSKTTSPRISTSNPKSVHGQGGSFALWTSLLPGLMSLFASYRRCEPMQGASNMDMRVIQSLVGSASRLE